MNDLRTFNINDSTIALKLIKEHGLNIHEATRIILTAPVRYKVYTVDKKYKKGKRTIAHPSVALKIIQRWLTRNYLDELPVHPAATAYEQKTSIKENARRHIKNKYLMKLDFKKFFPSIKPADLLTVLKVRDFKLTPSDKIVVSSLLFWLPKGSDELQLSIGAPSSPKISNLVMYSFDDTVSNYSNNKGIVYTRYADDLTFSTNTPHILEDCLSFVEEVIGSVFSPRLELNKSKTVFSSKKFNRRVTGLVLTNDEKVSLGRDKKREIRAMIHHFINGRLSPEQRMKLSGVLAYVNAVETEFIGRMCHKYGRDVIEKIMSHQFTLTG